MKPLILAFTFAALVAVNSPAQNAGAGATSAAGPQGNPAAHAESERNAASANKDNSAISGDQITKPAGAKDSTVIGCLVGPDSEGHFSLHSMQYRSGVEVLGPNDLENAAGSKVKLTGQWVKAAESESVAGKKPARRFQVTSVERMNEQCSSPAETTPVSKQKQKQKQQEQKQQEQKAAASEKQNNNPQ